MMAHEVRNPVAVISTAAQTMGILTDQDDLKPRIAKILGAAHRIAQLMDNLMASERLATTGASLRSEPGDLAVYCGQLANGLSVMHGRPIRYEAPAEAIRLTADWQLLGIAIGNLIDNAVKYTPATGTIGLQVQRTASDRVCIEVADDGPGIPPEEQRQIFEKFSRGQNGPRVPGAGLGLYLVQFIARLHGGQVELVSAPGTGSRFRILLPVRE